MRLLPFCLLVLPALLAACRSGDSVPEPGAILVQVKSKAARAPDELRVWVYDHDGTLWDNQRVPAEGALVARSAQDLGSILIQPGAWPGELRIHIEGFAGGAAFLDGVLKLEGLSGNRTVVLTLDGNLLPDDDGDGVPDAIDDCPGPNPGQGGCPAGDAGADGPSSAGGSDGRDGARAGDGAPEGPLSGDTVDDGPSARAEVPPEADVGMPDESSGDDGPGDDGPAPDEPSAAHGDAGADAIADAPSPTPDAADARPDLPSDPTPDESLRADLADLRPAGVQGSPCTAGSECASGTCYDGVCCNIACTGPCRSCNQPSSNGVCQAYASGTDPEHECGLGATCNGAGACSWVPATNLPNGQMCSSSSQCLSKFCVDGVCCNSACADSCWNCATGTCRQVLHGEDPPQCTNGKTCTPSKGCT